MARIIRSIVEFFKPFGQVFRSLPKQYYTTLFFLVIPLVFLLNAATIFQNRGKFFMINTDPEYFFLYNGTLIGGGNLSVEYTSNPGTPLMVLIGISTRVVSLFQPGNYYEEVVNDPEKYIRAANLFLVSLIALLLFVGGKYLMKLTGSRTAALIFQMSLLGSTSLMFLASMLKAELMTVIPVLLMCLAVARYVFKNPDGEMTTDKTLVLFGLIGGLGMASKLIFIPLMLIPFILLKTSFLKKLRLLLYTLLAFAVFAYPVVFNNGKFWNWVADIFSHTGKYGAGQAGFIDLASIPGNLQRLYEADKAFFFITGLALVVGTIASIIHRKDEDTADRRLSRAVLAVGVAVICCIALVLKHFEVYYFYPVYGVKFFMIALIFLLILRIKQVSRRRLVQGIATVILVLPVIFICYKEALLIRSSNGWVANRTVLLEKKHRQIMSVYEPGSPVIISSRFNGAPFPEFAHYEGFKMSFKLRKSFIPYLKARYPVSYQYVDWDKKFYYWDSFVDMKGILGKTSRAFYVYIGEGKAADLTVIEERIGLAIEKTALSREVVYSDPGTGEQLIRYSLL